MRRRPTIVVASAFTVRLRLSYARVSASRQREAIRRLEGRFSA